MVHRIDSFLKILFKFEIICNISLQQSRRIFKSKEFQSTIKFQNSLSNTVQKYL